MPRPKAEAPSISVHISGQAVAKFDGISFYLGKHNSPEAFAKYAYLLKAYQNNGFRLPSEITPQSVRLMAGDLGMETAGGCTETVNQADEPILVKHMTEAYRNHVLVRYKDSLSEKNRLLQVCKILEKECAGMEADHFGPRTLLRMRSEWVRSDKSRQYCNRLTNAVVRMFKWAVSQELVGIAAYQRLKTIEPLRIGESEARETKPVLPANLDHVRATTEHLPPQLRAVIRIQVATGARPSEILMMTPAEIDRTGEDWIYRPAKHKNAKRKKARCTWSCSSWFPRKRMHSTKRFDMSIDRSWSNLIARSRG
jgi:hypothetical protein